MERRLTSPHLRRLLPEARPVGPAYLWLATALKTLILDGRLPLGVRLPAERELADTLSLSRTTITAAYGRLREEGYLSSRRGAGTFAAFPADGPVGPSWLPGEVAPDALDLSIAAPAALAEPVSAAAAAAVEQLPRHLRRDGYHVLGLPELRDAIARRYAERGVPTSPDEVIVTPGAQGALALLGRVLLSPGAPTLVESPTYPNALDCLRAESARLLTVPVESGEWDEELLESAFRQTLPRLAYLVPEFHNPTGQLMPSSTRALAVRAARAADAHLVVDESCLGLGFADGVVDLEPVAAYDPERVISVGALSKVAWGGLRIGWIRANASLVRRLATARPAFDLASPLLEQLVTLELLGQLDELLAARRALLATGLATLREGLEELPGWRLLEPQGGLSAWISLDCSSTALAAAAADEGLRLVAGPRFGTDGALERFLRLPFVLPPARLREAVERLVRAREHVPPFAAVRELSYVV